MVGVRPGFSSPPSAKRLGVFRMRPNLGGKPTQIWGCPPTTPGGAGAPLLGVGGRSALEPQVPGLAGVHPGGASRGTPRTGVSGVEKRPHRNAFSGSLGRTPLATPGSGGVPLGVPARPLEDPRKTPKLGVWGGQILGSGEAENAYFWGAFSRFTHKTGFFLHPVLKKSQKNGLFYKNPKSGQLTEIMAF